MQGKKILVIDDDYSLCQMIKFSFNRAGAQVFTANDGREGLHQFYSQRPDLVVLDVRMPDIDGWEACRQIRMLSSVPIIMLTTLDKDEEIIRGLNFGADDFVTKPFSREVLMARCALFCGGLKHQQRLAAPATVITILSSTWKNTWSLSTASPCS